MFDVFLKKSDKNKIKKLEKNKKLKDKRKSLLGDAASY